MNKLPKRTIQPWLKNQGGVPFPGPKNRSYFVNFETHSHTCAKKNVTLHLDITKHKLFSFICSSNPFGCLLIQPCWPELCIHQASPLWTGENPPTQAGIRFVDIIPSHMAVSSKQGVFFADTRSMVVAGSHKRWDRQNITPKNGKHKTTIDQMLPITGQLKPQRFTFPRFQWLLQQRSRCVVDHFLHLGGNAQGPGIQMFQECFCLPSLQKIEPEVSKNMEQNRTDWSHALDMSFQQKYFQFRKVFWKKKPTYKAKNLW